MALTGELNKTLAAIARPPLTAVKWLASTVFALLFGKSDVKLAVKHQRDLEAALRTDLPFLFEHHDATIVNNTGVHFPPSFDYAYVTVRVGNLLLRFLRGRGELSAEIKSLDGREWHDLAAVLEAIEVSGRDERNHIESLTQMAAILASNIERLRSSFSANGYPELIQRLSRIREHDQASNRQLQNEINRRLYE